MSQINTYINTDWQKKAAVLDIKRQCSCFLYAEEAANAAKVINAADAANAAKTAKAADTAAKALQGKPWVTEGNSLLS